jgi:non-ribosomal peptide synthetase component E (peptide arylation enzyme)
MRPSLLTPETIDRYLADGHWSRETMIDRYRAFARTVPERTACLDETDTFSWEALDRVTDTLAANLIALDLERDSTALVQTASSCREVLIRIAFKKAGLIGAFAPLQWRRKEMDDVAERIAPSLLIADATTLDMSADIRRRVDLSNSGAAGWIDWDRLLDRDEAEIPDDRPFAFDEISLITVSSGTSGIAKLCEWPEAAQICMGRVIGERMGFRDDDTVGVFAPMAGAAGLLVWTVSATTPCTFVFPSSYHADHLLDLAERRQITIATTVPVILARLAQETSGSHDLSALRMLRVGTAAADVDAARTFETRTGCKVITASGAMECPGFGHASPEEPIDRRLDGSVGLPLRCCRLRIDDENGAALPLGAIGQVKVSAPFASSGYWRDPPGTEAVWQDGWYATGDMGRLDETGRLSLLGRMKETINRSGHKILPIEIETEIAKHPSVFACAVAGAPDQEYGAVPWAFVQLRAGHDLDSAVLADGLRDSGMARYKIPVRFVEVAELPRINGNKVDKQALLAMAPPA